MVYFLLMLLLTVKEGYALFAAHSEIALYYLIVRAFDPIFYMAYSAHIIRLVLSLIHCLPILLYAYRIRFLSTKFWQYLFVFRCIFEVIGHSYEMNSLIATFYINPQYPLVVLIIMSIPFVPSYIACYWYAFRQEKILGAN